MSTTSIDSAEVESYQKRNRYKGRESNTVPHSVSVQLEDAEDSFHAVKPPRLSFFQNVSSLKYILALIILMICDLILVAGGIYLSTIAFLQDVEWNEILYNQRPFPKLKGDSYFGGKRLKDLKPKLIPAVLNATEIEQDLERHHSLEIVALVFAMSCFAISAVMCIFFILWPKFRHRLHFTYLGFGLQGVALFIAASLMIISSHGQILQGMVDTRVELERGGELNITAQDAHSLHYQNQKNHYHASDDFLGLSKLRAGGGGGSATGSQKAEGKKSKNCHIHPSVNETEIIDKLLKIMKICAYRFIALNTEDPCLNVSAVKIVWIEEKSYDLKDLEKLTICPMDLQKVVAFFMILLASFVCFFIMWIGSHAQKSIYVPHVDKDRLVWSPDIFTKGWQTRKTLSFLEIEMSMRPENADLTVPDLTMDDNGIMSGSSMRISKLGNVSNPNSNSNTQIMGLPSPSIRSIMTPSSHPPTSSMPPTSLLSVMQQSRHPGSSHFRPGGSHMHLSDHRHQSHHPELNIMIIAPGMVIHPPAIKQSIARAASVMDAHGHGTVLQGVVPQDFSLFTPITSWFNDKE